jgi:hypothetical protein
MLLAQSSSVLFGSRRSFFFLPSVSVLQPNFSAAFCYTRQGSVRHELFAGCCRGAVSCHTIMQELHTNGYDWDKAPVRWDLISQPLDCTKGGPWRGEEEENITEESRFSPYEVYVTYICTCWSHGNVPACIHARLRALHLLWVVSYVRNK